MPEDIDALFSVIRKGFTGQSWRNIDEFVEIARASLAHFTGKVVVEVVKDTFDFKQWLGDPTVVNRQLANFSRHGPHLFHPGMHVFR